MNKRVLITGIGGFCGAHVLMHFLHNTDWEIIGIDSFRHLGKTDRISDVLRAYPDYWDRITILTHDLVAPFSDQFVSRMGKIDYIVNLASLSHVDTSIKDPRDFVNNNVGLMLTMLEYAREYPVEKFLHISTDEVYGPAAEDYGHIEGDFHRPSNPYSASKAAQEDLGHAYWRTYSTEDKAFSYIQTNTMNLFGEAQDPEKLVPRVIKCAMTGESMPIFANKDKTAAGTRKWLHARNQADALLFILKNIEPTNFLLGDPAPPVFNIVGDNEISNLDMALLVAKFVGNKLNYELVDVHSHRPGHDLRYSLNGTKLAKLGWKAPMSFEESLRSTVEWTKNHQEWIL